MSGKGRPRNEKASASRLAAVQALYQLDLDSVGLEQAIDTVKARGASLDEGGLSAEIDPDRMETIVRGVAGDHAGRLDGMIDGSLSGGWNTGRLESLMRVILRAGIYELLECPDVPARVVINEYVEVAHAFFDRNEPGMVNAVLDRLARILRAGEFAASA
jgi:transcription antitermination protein NusB